MERKEFASQMMKTTACTLRLVKPYFGTKRCVIADSWFASVTCAVELLKRGLYFIGIVKSRSCEYPKKYLHESAFTRESIRGVTHTSHSITQYGTLIAHCWYEPGPDKVHKQQATGTVARKMKEKSGNKKMKRFISTAYTALPVEPWSRPRDIQNQGGVIVTHNLDIPQSQIVQAYMYFSKANAIDIHNQYGQYNLGIETVWKMTDWWKRLFQFIIRTCISLVNKYLAYCYFEKIETNHILFRQVVNQVAVQLCWARKTPVSVISRGHVTGGFPSICSMESVKEVFPNLNHKGSGRCKVETTGGDNVVQKHITFAGNAPTFLVAKSPN